MLHKPCSLRESRKDRTNAAVNQNLASMEYSEQQLIERLRKRDRSAFRELVERHGAGIYNLVFRLLGQREEAEDVAQEVFMAVFKYIDNFRGESQLSTWLYRIAVNHCSNRRKYLTRRRKETEQQLPTDGGPPLTDAAAGYDTAAMQQTKQGPEQLTANHELSKNIEKALAALDNEQRTLIVLRDIQGLSYQEICVITLLAEGTVKSRLHRARMCLKEQLRQHWE